jgi:hypothetical protein
MHTLIIITHKHTHSLSNMHTRTQNLTQTENFFLEANGVHSLAFAVLLWGTARGDSVCVSAGKAAIVEVLFMFRIMLTRKRSSTLRDARALVLW